MSICTPMQVFSTPAIDRQLRWTCIWKLYHGIDCKTVSWVGIAAFFLGPLSPRNSRDHDTPPAPSLEQDTNIARSSAAAATDLERRNYGIPVTEWLPVSGFGGLVGRFVHQVRRSY